MLASIAASAYLTWPHADKWYQTYLYRREAARWYAQGAAWAEPVTKLKYTENPDDAPGGKFEQAYGKRGSTTFTGYKSFGGHFVERLPCFYAGGIPALDGTPDQVHLFMHERTTSAGLTRLIVVSNPHFNGESLSLSTNQIGTIDGDMRTIRGGSEDIDMTGIAGPGEIRIYAGQPDPNDRSRFSIPFESRGRRGWFDGVYKPGPSFSTDPSKAQIEQEANSRIAFTIRLEPATRPATTQPDATRALAAPE